MAEVKLTTHLFEFFPDLRGREIIVDGGTVAEVIRNLDAMAPGIAFYLCDERGSLRTHVNVFIDDERVVDRRRLRDAVDDEACVFIMQALSGG